MLDFFVVYHACEAAYSSITSIAASVLIVSAPASISAITSATVQILPAALILHLSPTVSLISLTVRGVAPILLKPEESLM